jgi:hypothetical protein
MQARRPAGPSAPSQAPGTSPGAPRSRPLQYVPKVTRWIKPTQGEIVARAKALYHQSGAQPGHDVQNWLEAERQLLDEKKQTVLLLTPELRVDSAKPAALLKNPGRAERSLERLRIVAHASVRGYERLKPSELGMLAGVVFVVAVVTGYAGLFFGSMGLGALAVQRRVAAWLD